MVRRKDACRVITVTPDGLLDHVPMTVRWVLAVMLVTTLVATHSHSPWSSLLRARNWRLPLGRALCLLLLGFPTLAKQGAGKRMGAGIQVKGRMLTTQESSEEDDGGVASPEPSANTPPLSSNVASPPNIWPVHTVPNRTTTGSSLPPPQCKSFKAQVPSSR